MRHSRMNDATRGLVSIGLIVALAACGGGDGGFEDIGANGRTDGGGDVDIDDLEDLGDLGDLGDIDGLDDLNLPDGVLEQVLEGLSDEGIDVDIDDGGFSVSNEDGQFTMGTDLDPPDWLPGGFPLPDDISIQGYGQEDGTRSVIATIAGAAGIADQRDRIVAWYESNGYEVLNDVTTADQLRLTGVRDDGEVIDVDMNVGYFSIEISRRDVTFDRQDAAEVVETTGTATVVIGSDSYTVDGTCMIQGADYQFEYYAIDGSTSVAVNIYAVTEPAQGSAFFARFTDDLFEQYIVNFPMSNDNEPTVTTGERAFGVSGELFDMAGGTGNVEGSFAVECAG